MDRCSLPTIKLCCSQPPLNPPAILKVVGEKSYICCFLLVLKTLTNQLNFSPRFILLYFKIRSQILHQVVLRIFCQLIFILLQALWNLGGAGRREQWGNASRKQIQLWIHPYKAELIFFRKLDYSLYTLEVLFHRIN